MARTGAASSLQPMEEKQKVSNQSDRPRPTPASCGELPPEGTLRAPKKFPTDGKGSNMRALLWMSLISALTLPPALAADPIPDSTASYSGPFGGAQGQSQLAQSFEMSVTGFLNGIEAFVPSNSGPSCEFTWYLRDGATLDSQNPDIAALPIFATGTGMTDTPALIYDAAPSVLLTGANIPVAAGDRLVLHIVHECALLWILGAGLLPGDRFQFDGATWGLPQVSTLEFGRIIYATEAGTAVEESPWSVMKLRYR